MRHISLVSPLRIYFSRSVSVFAAVCHRPHSYSQFVSLSLSLSGFPVFLSPSLSFLPPSFLPLLPLSVLHRSLSLSASPMTPFSLSVSLSVHPTPVLCARSSTSPPKSNISIFLFFPSLHSIILSGGCLCWLFFFL